MIFMDFFLNLFGFHPLGLEFVLDFHLKFLDFFQIFWISP